VGLQLILLMTFGRTLLAGRQPLCTRFAQAAHTPLTPQHELYARRVTVAWTLFFAAMALISTLLIFPGAAGHLVAFCQFSDATSDCPDGYCRVLDTQMGAA